MRPATSSLATLSRLVRPTHASACVGWSAHAEGVDRLLASFAAVPAEQQVRLAKSTSNLFRERSRARGPGLDTSGLTGVVEVDPATRTAEVQGMCTYETLVDATLAHGLLPLVVPQLKTITLGGAVTGLGIESTSFRHGLPHESVRSMDVLTGTGEVVTASPDGTADEQALWRGFPNSYGSLGYAVRLRIELEEAPPFVALRSVRLDDLDALQDTLARVAETGAHDGERVDAVDAVVFAADECYVVLARWSDEPGPTSDYTGRQVYYRSLQHPSGTTHDRLTIRDYVWRWDTDWFWCSRAFGAQDPRVRRLWPRRWLRSSVYWRLVALDRRFAVADRLERRAGRPPRERVVQDVEVEVGRTADFLRWFVAEVPVEPVWLCPLRLRESSDAPGADRPWPLYPLRPGRTYVNIGFWSTVPATPGDPSACNRAVEQAVGRMGGHKSLYSEAFYDEATFAALYGGDHAQRLKTRFDPGSRFPTLYDKAVRRR
ncbi:FAD-binding oxidoreductase [Janibacter sp. UYMM211]|uniref:FAD-binding oxidoreductase n=1 Tax=Janibacter sp. UYMM211 TaxID=3156342 RepID=UPI00339A8A93